MATEDEAVLVGVTSENREAVAALDDILAVSNLAFVFAGPHGPAVSGWLEEFEGPRN